MVTIVFAFLFARQHFPYNSDCMLTNSGKAKGATWFSGLPDYIYSFFIPFLTSLGFFHAYLCAVCLYVCICVHVYVCV